MHEKFPPFKRGVCKKFYPVLRGGGARKVSILVILLRSDLISAEHLLIHHYVETCTILMHQLVKPQIETN